MKNIMIKTAIASAVVAATTATAVADVTLYGRLNIKVTDTNADGSELNVNNSGSRFGMKASSDISDGLSAFGKYEFATDIDNGGKNESTRLAFVGLKGGFGEVSLGTRWSPLYSHTISPIDAPNAFGGTSGSYGYQTDFRNSNTINYKNKFGAASVGVQLQMGNYDVADDPSTVADETVVDDNAVDEFTIGVSVPVGAATVGLGYQSNEAADDDITALHARTKFGAFGVGATYATSDNLDTILLAANYGMGGGKSINLTYGQSDADASNAKPTTIGLEYLHKMGGGFRWYAGYMTNDADVAGTDSVNKYGAGMRYDF